MTTTHSTGIRRVSIKTDGGVVTDTVVDEGYAGTSSYTLADSGSGYQITRLLGNKRDWYFAARELWRIGLYDVGDASFHGWWDSDTFATPVVVDSGSTFTMSWTNAQASLVTVVGTRDSTRHSLALTLTISLGGTDASTYAINRVEFPRLAIKPYEQGLYKQFQCCAVPSRDGLVRPNIVDSTLEMDVPGPLTHIEPDAVSSGKPIGSAQFVYHYHTGADAGLLIRTTDTLPRFKRFSTVGADPNVNFTITHVPTNHLATTSWTMPYSVEMVPMPGGDWYDGAVKYRDLVEDDQMPWTTRGKLRDITRDWVMDAHAWVHTGGAFTPTVLQQFDDLKTYVGNDVTFAHWSQVGQGRSWPDWALGPTNQVLVKEFTGRQVPSVVYFIVQVDAGSSWYDEGGDAGVWQLTGATNPADIEVLNPDQERPTAGKVGVDIGLGGWSEHWSEIERLYRKIFDDENPDARIAVYWDAATTVFPADYRTGRSGIGVGPGSYQHQYDLQQRWTADDNLNVSEHVQEHFINSLSAMSITGVILTDIALGFRRCGMMPTVYSEYCRMYATLGTILVPDYDSYGEDATDWLLPFILHEMMYRFSFGQIPSIILPDDVVIFGDIHATNAQQYVLSNYKWMVRWVKWYGHYFRGRRLRPPPNCRERQVESEGWELTTTFTGQTDFFDAAPGYEAAYSVPSGEDFQPTVSVWQSFESAGRPLGIILSNPTSTDMTYTLELDRLKYPELAENEYLVETDPESGSRTLVEQNLHGFNAEITLPANSSKFLEAVSRYNVYGAFNLFGSSGSFLLPDGTPFALPQRRFLALPGGGMDNLFLLPNDPYA